MKFDEEKNILYHKNEDSYNKEIGLSNLNNSAFLKINDADITPEKMIELLLGALRKLKEMEEK